MFYFAEFEKTQIKSACSCGLENLQRSKIAIKKKPARLARCGQNFLGGLKGPISSYRSRKMTLLRDRNAFQRMSLRSERIDEPRIFFPPSSKRRRPAHEETQLFLKIKKIKFSWNLLCKAFHIFPLSEASNQFRPTKSRNLLQRRPTCS